MSPGRRSRCGSKLGIGPALDVLHDLGFVNVVEKVVKTPLIKLQCFVDGADLVVKVLAAAGIRVLVGSAVKNQDRQSN